MHSLADDLNKATQAYINGGDINPLELPGIEIINIPDYDYCMATGCGQLMTFARRTVGDKTEVSKLVIFDNDETRIPLTIQELTDALLAFMNRWKKWRGIR